MKKELLNATRKHLEANIAKHVVNIKVILNNPISIPEHTDIMSAIELELGHIAEYEDKLQVLMNYFTEYTV